MGTCFTRTCVKQPTTRLAAKRVKTLTIAAPDPWLRWAGFFLWHQSVTESVEAPSSLQPERCALWSPPNGPAPGTAPKVRRRVSEVRAASMWTKCKAAKRWMCCSYLQVVVTRSCRVKGLRRTEVLPGRCRRSTFGVSFQVVLALWFRCWTGSLSSRLD